MSDIQAWMTDAEITEALEARKRLPPAETDSWERYPKDTRLSKGPAPPTQRFSPLSD